MKDDITGIILAGGKSKRLHTNKAFLKIGKETIIELVLGKIKDIFKEIIIAANEIERFNFLGTRVVSDIIPSKGPLGGIYTGLVRSDSFYNFVVACDMPSVSPELIQYMLKESPGYDVVVVKYNDRFQPQIKTIEEISLTTNAVLLLGYAEELKKAGLKRINISLDTLRQSRFKQMTRDDSFGDVIKGIDRAIDLGFYPLKLNMVVMRGINEDEIIDFVDFAQSRRLILRFIELMKVTPLWRKEYFIPIEEVQDICRKKFKLIRLDKLDCSPAIYYKIKDGGILGFIKTSESNCRCCSRLRLSSTGELRLCLYETHGLYLRYLLRTGASDWQIREKIKDRISMKPDINFKNYKSSKSYMCNIGG